MRNSINRLLGSCIFILLGCLLATTATAQTLQIPGTDLPVDGKSRLKTPFGKFAELNSGRISFRNSGRFVLDLPGFLRLIGDYVVSNNGKRVTLDPDPTSVENALQSLLEGTQFEFALRGVEQDKVKLKVKVKLKNDQEIARVRLKIKFKASLALASGDPEVVKAFPMKYSYKGKTNPPQ